MYEELNKCKHLLTKFGGHKLAAGLSMEAENLEYLRRELNENTGLTEEDLMPRISIDMQMPFQHISEELIEQLSLLEPFGKGNGKPVFVEKNLEVLDSKILGKNRNVVKMQVRDAGGTIVDAVYFGDVERFLTFMQQKQGEPVAFTYYPTVNEFQGKKVLQIVIQNYK